jgi:ribosomal protein S18 acetylase RimI-like enzyme
MTNTIEIRKATLHDLDMLLNFEQGVINAERAFDPTLKEGLIHYYDLRKMLVDTQAEIAVAEYGHEIIASGFARIENAKPYLKHQQHAYLGFMYVHPLYRGKGINIRIVEKLTQFAKSRGITEIRLEVYAGNESAIKAYEKAGFQKHIIEMRMDI